MLCDSNKVKDPMKVGRFGLGFKSVFHMTGRCVITRNNSRFVYQIVCIKCYIQRFLLSFLFRESLAMLRIKKFDLLFVTRKLANSL